MTGMSSLAVVGAGPYGVAVAAHARERGIDTTVIGRPMEFWTRHMPEGMFLRSGLDWHLDAAGEHTFEAFAEERGISPQDVDPVPIAVFLAYAGWFQARKHVAATEKLVTSISRADDRFALTLDDDTVLTADRVVVTPGARFFRRVPDWASRLERRGAHTVDFVNFDGVAGARVLVVGGRQSAYEWAALLGDHGARRVDIVHRHAEPRFDRVSWAFADPYLEQTLAVPGWWRTLPTDERQAIERRFWEVGRLTLEWWLVPRLAGDRFHRWPGTHVAEAAERPDGTVHVALANGEKLEVDQVLFATGYQPDLSKVPFLREVLPAIDVTDGYPVLDEWFQTSVPGLYVTGFAATRDFGPFFGFTKGCPAAARLVVDGLLRSG
jgi:FAD-dependent urate hydroxylase